MMLSEIIHDMQEMYWKYGDMHVNIEIAGSNKFLSLNSWEAIENEEDGEMYFILRELWSGHLKLVKNGE